MTKYKLDGVLDKLNLTRDEVRPYGWDIAKLPLSLFEDRPQRGKLVLVTAITPTPAGEGKTTTTIGLSQALDRLGHSVCAALREPSLGPCFGIKGGGTGGGKSTLVPAAQINLHFTGDLHAITAAHNLLSALIDNHLHFDSQPRLDPRRVVWKRVLDQNDRALRSILVGLGGRTQGVPRESGFDITAASEVMAMLCLAQSADDLRARIDRTLIGYSPDREPVTAGQIGATGAMMALLNDALMPNLVQTVEGTPAIVHGGPFANIAHGCNSVLATRAALSLADIVVTEAGFGCDLGAEKFFHIKCRGAGLDPHAVVLVSTIRALKYHGGVALDALETPSPEAVRRGLVNLQKHLETLRAFGKPVLVAQNSFYSDTTDEIAVVRDFCQVQGVPFAVSEHFAKGGVGAEQLAAELVQLLAQESPPFRPMYSEDALIVDKIRAVAQTVYGADEIVLSKAAKASLGRFKRLGFGHLPICMAKTQSSLSDDPKRRGRPSGFVITVQDVQVNTGAGFLVVITGQMMRMPGLPRRPSAWKVDVVDGLIVGVG